MNDSDEVLRQRLHTMPIVPPSADFETRIIAGALKKRARKKNLWGLLVANWVMPKPGFVLASVMVFGLFIGWEGVALVEYQTLSVSVNETLVDFMYEGEN